MPFSFPYIPTLTLPKIIFANSCLATGFPVVVGMALGAKIPNPSYTSRHDPPFRPPDIVFPLVWTPLYALMGYSSHLAYTTLSHSSGPLSKHGSLTLYTLSLLLNFAFLPLYSLLGERWLGLLDMLLLDGCVVWLILEWGSLTPDDGARGGVLGREAWGLVPYAAWLVFATYLAVGYGVLNGWRSGGRQRWRVGKDGAKEKIG